MNPGRQFRRGTCGYYPCDMTNLTRTPTGVGDSVGRQLAPGRSPVRNGGAQGSPQNGWKSFVECKGRAGA